MRVLIVHGDASVRRQLDRGLSRAGLSVTSSADAAGAAAALERGRADPAGEAGRDVVDLALLDPELPSGDLTRLLEVLARHAVRAPVAWLTPEDLRDARTGRGPDLPPGLLERLRALLGPEPPVEVADLVVDVAAGTARRGGRRLELTPTEAAVLVLLARGAGTPVSREQLLRDVWGIDFDTGTNVVDVHVRRLRAKLDDPFPRPLLHTVRGRGYMLAARASGDDPTPPPPGGGPREGGASGEAR